MNLYKVGSIVTTDPTIIRNLSCNIEATSCYMTLELPRGTDYQVPPGKTLYISGYRSDQTSADSGFSIGYGDTAVGSGAAAPTSFVELTFRDCVSHTTADGAPRAIAPIAIPTGKYPCMKMFGSGEIYLNIQGIEVTNPT